MGIIQTSCPARLWTVYLPPANKQERGLASQSCGKPSRLEQYGSTSVPLWDNRPTTGHSLSPTKAITARLSTLFCVGPFPAKFTGGNGRLSVLRTTPPIWLLSIGAR